jgi:peptide/nickel transport system substrate-binding protein
MKNGVLLVILTVYNNKSLVCDLNRNYFELGGIHMLLNKLKISLLIGILLILAAACSTSNQDTGSSNGEEGKTSERNGLKTEDDGQTWTFTILDNVIFQNGNKVDAKAVKSSLERNIEVSAAMKNSLKIKELKADGQILTITTEQPLPQLPSELVHPNTAIIDSSESNFDQNPIGTGPFKVVSFDSSSKLELERYDEYWDGKANLEWATFTFNKDANARTLALQSGDADIVYRPAIESLEGLESDESIVTDVVPSLRTHLLMYNTSDEALKDTHVRKAFDSLIDLEEVVKSIMAGKAIIAEGPFLLSICSIL